MVSEIRLAVCDECNTIAYGESVWCAQCGEKMKSVRFVRLLEKDPPMILEDLPRPWSEDSMIKEKR